MIGFYAVLTTYSLNNLISYAGYMKKIKILIAGGGTGGHLFPGIAVAEEVQSRNRENEVLFVGTAQGLENTLLAKLGFKLRTITVGGVIGRGTVNTIKNIFLIPRSMNQSRRIIRDFEPDLALGVGGYASGPTILVARLAGIKTAIAEQNVQPGIANRILGGLVHKVFITYPETSRWFSPAKTVLCGNPVRSGFQRGQASAKPAGSKFTLLVFGGSQGAQAINEAMIDALFYLKESGLNLRIIHQTGQKDQGYVTKSYKDHGQDAEVLAFINDMPRVMREADLIICRAGATSIAEITSLGKAAILIPYPFATHDHQTKNAQALAGQGAAELILQRRLNGRALAQTIAKFYNNPESLSLMEKNAAALGKPDAAACIVDHLLAMIANSQKIEEKG